MKHLLHILLLGWTMALALAMAPSVVGNEGGYPAQPQQVNINTDNAETLADGLLGVGLSKAAAIVNYREKNGPFQEPSQLMEVKGIGERILVANEGRIEVGD